MAHPKPRLGYLSAAPTVSTRWCARSAGPRAHILGVIDGFRAAGFEVRPWIAGDRLPPAVAGGGVQAGLARSAGLRLLGDAARLVLGQASARRAWRELGGHVDLVYERFATLQVLGRRFRRAGVPWILETQGLFWQETAVERPSVGLPALARAVELGAYRACDLLVAVSEPLRDLLVQECRVDPAKILVVPNAVDPARFDPDRVGPAPRPFGDVLTLVFAGGLIGWQALDELLHSLAELRAEGLDTGLLVVGDGPMAAPWRELAARLGLADRVLFRGPVPGDAVAAELARADLGYSGPRPTVSGAMYHSPLKLYEYMAAAKPVLAAAFPDARKLVEGRGTGLLFAPGARASLKAALRTAHGRRAHLPAMGRAARALVVAEHGWEARVRLLLPAALRLLVRAAACRETARSPGGRAGSGPGGSVGAAGAGATGGSPAC